MTHPALIERITRSLAYMLRHQPEQFDLELDRYGYAELTEVVQALNERLDEPIEEEDLEDAVKSGSATRYEIVGEKIRALYGHSIDVEPGEPSKPQEFLYVGLPVRDAERAMKAGLRGGRRRFLHLALSEEDAAETGRRLARRYAVIEVHALDAWEEGVNFYDRKSLFLSETIPTNYLEMGEVRDDGEGPPARRGERSGRGSRGGRSEGGRGRRGGRRHERDEDSPRDSGHAREESRDSGDREDGRERRRGRGRGRSRGGDDNGRSSERRPERGGERQREPRKERPAAEPKVVARDVPRPKKQQKSEPSADFGLGIFEAEKKQEKRPKRPAPKPEPAAETKPEPPSKPVESDGPTFGAGV